MKTMAFLTTVVLATATAFAQGTVNLNNNISGVLVTHVYWGYGQALAGNGINDFPQGTTDWSGYDAVQGSSWSAQLWAAEGLYLPDAALQPAYPITTFRTGAEAGFVEPVTATLTGVPSDAQFATVQLRVWDNQGGAIPDWNTALVNSLPKAVSPLFNVLDIGGGINPPPNLIGLQSFSAFVLVPEPSATALVGLGAAVLWLWSRRRSAG